MDSPCIKQTVCKVLKIFQYGKYLVAYVLKASQKTGPRIKVSSGRLGEAGNEPAISGLKDKKLFVAFLPPGWFNGVMIL